MWDCGKVPLQPFLYTFYLEMARFGAIWVDFVFEVAAETDACGLMQFTSRRISVARI